MPFEFTPSRRWPRPATTDTITTDTATTAAQRRAPRLRTLATATLSSVTLAAGLLLVGPAAQAADAQQAQDDAPKATAAPKPTAAQLAAHPPAKGHRLDTSGRKQVGEASFYHRMFNGRKMADGTRMNPQDDNAASKTLPLGTKAKVTNLETGRSAVVTIQDRGPYVDGRIVDLSPSTAKQIGLTPEEGVAPVVVAPITVPLPDGRVKPGAAAGEAARDTARAD